jgi:formiminoglutamase
MNDWLTVTRGTQPLIISIPHAGTDIPGELEPCFASPWLARMDADFHMSRLYAFAAAMGATVISTAISRSVIDMNRDPSGKSLYPGQATTELCPLSTFDGRPLYRKSSEPTPDEISDRRGRYFLPYHGALVDEIARLKITHRHVVLYDAHSIRSHVPRLFDGELPVFNVGTNTGASCDGALGSAVAMIAAASGKPAVVNGRFKGGYITRHYGNPPNGIHAVQMELAIRSYAREPETLDETNWPPAFNHTLATETQDVLKRILAACLSFAKEAA